MPSVLKSTGEQASERHGCDGKMWGVNGIPVCNQSGNSAPVHCIAADGNGGAVIAWQDQRGTSTNLYAQRVDRSGAVRWVVNGTAPGTQGSPTVAMVANRGAVFAWVDSRRMQYTDIFGQGVDSTGALGGTTSVGQASLPSTFRLEQNYPNPFNPITNIGFRIADFGFVSLKVFDVLGREVVTLVNENLSAGSYEATFDAKGLASGVYLCRLTSGGQSLSRKLTLTK